MGGQLQRISANARNRKKTVFQTADQVSHEGTLRREESQVAMTYEQGVSLIPIQTLQAPMMGQKKRK